MEHSALHTIGCVWDPQHRLFEGRRGRVLLSPSESGLVEALLQAEGEPVHRDALAGGDLAGRRIDFAVRRLREKIEEDPGDPRIVLTVHGFGYRLGLPRIAPTPTSHPWVVVGDCKVDATLGVIERIGDEIVLTTLQREVLHVLLEAEARPVLREELYRRVWGRYDRGQRAVDAIVHQLRSIIEPAPAEPRFLLTVPGGYRLCRSRATTNLSDDAEALIGRVEVLQEVLASARAPGCCVLAGPPGAGKSLLAEHACRILSRELAGGAWWVDCAPLRSSGDVLRDTASVLGLVGRSVDLPLLVNLLSKRPPTAIVLDNLEQIEDIEPVLTALASAGGRIIATSSRRLMVRGKTLVLGGVSVREGRELYLQTAHRAGMTPDPADVDLLVSTLDGLPLAIVLAARRADVLTARALHEHRDRLHLLHERRPAGRHGSLDAAIDWAMALASHQERRILRGCALFQSPFTAEAARAVTGAEIGDIERLVDRSLLRALDIRGQRCFRLYGVIADHLRSVAPIEAELVLRADAWSLSRATSLRAQSESEIQAEIERTLPDLLAAAWRAVDRPESAGQIVMLLLEYTWLPVEVVSPIVEALLAAQVPFSTRGELYASQISSIALRTGGKMAAEQALQRALALGLDPEGWTCRSIRLSFGILYTTGPADPGLCPARPHDIEWARWKAHYLSLTGHSYDAIALLRETIRQGQREGRHLSILLLEIALAELQGGCGYPPGEVADALERCWQTLKELGRLEESASCAWMAANYRICEGRLHQARLLADWSVETSQILDRPLLGLRARLALLRTRLCDDPEVILRETLDLAASGRILGDGPGLSMCRLFETLCCARLGDISRVCALAREAAADPHPYAVATLAVAAVVEPSIEMPAGPQTTAMSWRVVQFVSHLLQDSPLPRVIERERLVNPLLRAIASIPSRCHRTHPQ